MALYKEFTHPVLESKTIKNGFSIPAFFCSWLFFFYHKCFITGVLIIALNAGTYFLVKIIEDQCFQIYRENDDGYQSSMKDYDKLRELDTSSFSNSNMLLYYNTQSDILSQANERVTWWFNSEYEGTFIMLDCILLIVIWGVFSFKQSEILEKKLLSYGYKLNFEAEAPNKAMFLAMASSSHNINAVPVEEKMNLPHASMEVLKTETNPVKKESQVIKSKKSDWQKQSSEHLRKAKETEAKQKEKKIVNDNSFDPPACI